MRAARLTTDARPGLTAARYIAQLERDTAAGLNAHGFTIKRKADGTEVIARVVKKRKTA